MLLVSIPFSIICCDRLRTFIKILDPVCVNETVLCYDAQKHLVCIVSTGTRTYTFAINVHG